LVGVEQIGVGDPDLRKFAGKIILNVSDDQVLALEHDVGRRLAGVVEDGGCQVEADT
jgi:hypothetical protein